MQSKNYERAQRIVLSDKYEAVSGDFNADLAVLAKRYFEVDCIKSETYFDDTLQIVITLSVKKVKQIKRVLA